MQNSIWVLGKLPYMWYSWRGMAVAIIMAPPTEEYLKWRMGGKGKKK